MLETEKYYHVYNRANGFENLFVNDGNYSFFVEKLNIYLLSVLDIYAYCLMPNHFHLLVKIKSEEEIIKVIKNQTPNYERSTTYLKFQTLDKFIPYYISKQFSNLFSSYTQAFNKQQNRTGSLFQKGFKRKEVSGLNYLQEVIMYIHTNPVHHGFTDDFTSWVSSSYHVLTAKHDTFLSRNEVLSLFGDKNNFIFCHQQKNDFKKINKFLIE